LCGGTDPAVRVDAGAHALLSALPAVVGTPDAADRLGVQHAGELRGVLRSGDGHATGWFAAPGAAAAVPLLRIPGVADRGVAGDDPAVRGTRAGAAHEEVGQDRAVPTGTDRRQW